MTAIRVIGTGLIGTSAGLALSRAGYDVTLEDPSPTAQTLARDLGAGTLDADAIPDLVVVAAPPDVTGSVVASALGRWPSAVVTDVASVKVAILRDVVSRRADLSRYVGSHPMAGRERSGTIAARGDLFQGRAWVVVPHEGSDPDAVALVARVATDTGAAVRLMDPEGHDAAVAAVSHVPQVAASLVAARLRDLTEPALALSGQGLRDVTRIAASDERLWTQILAGNAGAVREVLAALHADLGEVIAALATVGTAEGVGALEVLARTIGNGNLGYALIPGKHGAAPTTYAIVAVVVPDEPGMLGRLLVAVGEAGVNLEDLELEHGLGLPFGIAEIAVLPGSAEHLARELTRRGWRLHS
ncbi:MAG TPA: prephenate dehydrogenase [Candidatus Lustribacter sp.]|nr:prephenate dehydrogenase [Candidatus Lustribacter sp.]